MKVQAVVLAGVLAAGAVLHTLVSALPGPSTLEIEQLAGRGWSIHGLRLQLDFTSARAAMLKLELERVVLPGGLAPLASVSIDCPQVLLSGARLECARGTISALSDGAEVSATLALEYRARQRQLALGLESGAGRFNLELGLAAGGAVVVRAEQVSVPALLPWLTQLYPLLGDYELDGGTLGFELSTAADDAAGLRARFDVDALTFSNRSGRLAGEALTFVVEAQATAEGDAPAQHWRGRLDMSISAGGVYAEPVYLDLGRYPVAGTAGFSYAADRGVLSVANFSAVQSGVVELEGSFVSTPANRLEQLQVHIKQLRFPAAYDSWLSGVMVGTPLAALESLGVASGTFEYRDGHAHALEIVLDAIDLEDRDGRFALYGLNGEIFWRNDGSDISASEVRIGGGHVLGAAFGATDLVLGIAGAAIDLLEPARLPLLGGALAIENFSLRDYGSDELALGFEAELEPIDLGQLTVALQWPPFSGTLSGRLPLLRYKGGVITLGGNLEAQAFDGDISVEGLRIEQPLGIVPVFSASVRLRNLDLEQVTEVVPFGRVSGRLDGDIDGLRLLKGEPVAFDARFRTPPDDDSRHRLSQRAVDTISRVAGGGAVLSTTFLRIFKNFAYDKLGISCRLQNDICHMDGVAQADEGYYIVKGAGLPRVDLIGRVREVQWSRLMSQLEQALNEGEFKVE